jgi:hypothetical protein
LNKELDGESFHYIKIVEYLDGINSITSELIPILGSNPRVIKAVNKYEARFWSLNIPEPTINKWFLCDKPASAGTKIASSCSQIIVAGNDVDEVPIDSPELVGKYFRVQILDYSNQWSFTTASREVVNKGLSIAFNPDGPDEKSVGRTLYDYIEIQNSDGNRTWKCPASVKLKISSMVNNRTYYKTIKKSAGYDDPCRYYYSAPINGNVKLQVFAPKTKYTSASKSDTNLIEGVPNLVATTPVRTFGSYRLSLRSNVSLTTSCNVREEYYSFSGTFMTTRWFTVNLRYGYGSAIRKPSYIGVIKGMVTCRANSKYGVAIDTYKVFSY